MSGRLIILPKKSYCPWNPKNIERVLRDERQHKEAQEREQLQRNQQESRQRLLALHDRKVDSQPEVSQHINLFAAEEEEYHKRIIENAGNLKKESNSGIKPLYLGQSAESDSFYLQVGKDPSHQPPTNAKEDRLKYRMDPMKEFQEREIPSSIAATLCTKQQQQQQGRNDCKPSKPSIESHQKHHRKKSSKSEDSVDHSDTESSFTDIYSLERRRRRSRSRKKSSSSSSRKRAKHSEDSSKNSIEEMRKRRAEREEVERQRQASLLLATSKSHSRYQNQFHPKLSRN